MHPISNPIGPVGPVANCLNPYPEKSGFRIRKIRKSGFFESCRARYGLSIRTFDAKMIFAGKISDRHNQRKIGGPILKQRRSISNSQQVHLTFHLQCFFAIHRLSLNWYESNFEEIFLEVPHSVLVIREPLEPYNLICSPQKCQ